MEQHIRLRELLVALDRQASVLGEIQMSCCSISQAQYYALLEIRKADSTSLIELSEALKLDSSTLSRTVNNLVNMGLVNRETDPANRRYVTISLTDDGRKAIDGIEVGLNLYCKRLLAAIPAQKQAAVLEGLRTLLEAMTVLDEGTPDASGLSGQ